MAALGRAQASIPTQLACVFALGYAVAGLWGTFLVIAHAFSGPAFFVGLALITVVLWGVGLRRAGLRRRASAFISLLKADPWPLGAGVIAVLAVVAVLWNTPAVVNFGVANPFRYWADALELADAGQVPSETLHWGSAYPPTVSKIVFNSLNAAMSYLGPGPLEVMDPLMKMGVIGMALGAWAVGRELGLRYSAPLLVVLAGATGGLFKQWDLLVGDNYARMVALGGLALALRALRVKTSLSIPAAAGVCFAAAGGIHLVPTAMTLGVLGAYAIVHVVASKRVRYTLAVGAIILATFGGVTAANLVLSGGDVGFELAQDPNRLDTDGGTFDPTRFLATGRAQQPLEDQPGTRAEQNGGWYDRPGDVYKRYMEHVTGLTAGPVPLVVIPIAATVLAVVALAWFPRTMRPLAAAAVLFGAALFTISLLYSFLYDTYVPGRFPHRRLFPYASLPLLLLGLTVLEAGLIALRRIRPLLPAALAALLVVVSLPSFVGTFRWDGETFERGYQALDEINWINQNLPCNARLLVGQRTGGTFQALTGRASITEGMAPYLRPTMLNDVVETVLETRRFFVRPEPHSDLLEKEDADYVVLVKNDWLFDMNALLRPGNPEKLQSADMLVLVHESPVMNVYEVRLSGDDEQPRPADFFGFEC